MGSQTSLKSQGKSSHSSTIVRNPPKEEVKRRISKDSPEVTKKRSLNLDSGIMKFSSDMFANSDSDQLMIRNIKSNLIKVPDTEIEYHKFIWNGDGREVYVTGTFTKWKNHLKMNKTGENEHTITVPLGKGTYEYKYIIDEEWRYNNNQPTIPDEFGHINNRITITTSTPHKPSTPDSIKNGYSQRIPENECFCGETPYLPLHLTKHLLNSREARSSGGNLQEWESYENRSEKYLPAPTHVTLQHMSLCEKRSTPQVSILASTERIKNKYVTLLYYKPLERRNYP